MKKVILLLLLSFFCTTIYSQKKKTSSKNTSTSVLAKADNLTAEIIKGKLYLCINNKGSKKDTISIKAIDTKNLPKDCKILAFKSKETPLYLVTWNENTLNQTTDKKEIIETTNSYIFDVSIKSNVLANTQSVSKITEKVYLDKNKTVSETQETVHNEGFIFTLTNEGDVVLNTKKQQKKLIYDAATKKYLEAKKK